MGYLMKRSNNKVIDVNNCNLSNEFIDTFCEGLTNDIEELHLSNT